MRSIARSVVVLALAGNAPASAQFAVDHPPYPVGGPGADTALASTSYPFTWQEVADDFRVVTPASVTHVTWWGFYTESTAPVTETMRVRLYDSRAANGLPGELLFDEEFVNPQRIETGRTIAVGGTPREYKYHVALGKPMKLAPGLAYWIEIAQIADPDSGFRWEFSLADTMAFARRNNLFPEWGLYTPQADLAFQLIVPEPVTSAFFLIGLGFAAGLRARGGVRRLRTGR